MDNVSIRAKLTTYTVYYCVYSLTKVIILSVSHLCYSIAIGIIIVIIITISIIY